jgi:hypothetical protein
MCIPALPREIKMFAKPFQKSFSSEIFVVGFRQLVITNSQSSRKPFRHFKLQKVRLEQSPVLHLMEISGFAPHQDRILPSIETPRHKIITMN